MAFPTVQTTNKNVTTTVDTTSHAITMPTGITAGDLLVIIFSVDGSPTCSISSGGWTKIGQASNGSIVTGAVFAKIAAGSDTATVTTSAAEQSSHVTYRILTGGGNIWLNGLASNGSSTNSNPPAHFAGGNPGTTADYLWIATRSGDSTVTGLAPANYTSPQTQAASGTSGASTNTAQRALTAQSEDPGTFTSTTEQWVSWTLAIGPVIEPAFTFSDLSSAVTHSFTPPNSSLLVALCSGTNGGLVTMSDSLGGTWTRLARAEAADQAAKGQAEIWVRDVVTGASMTVTAANTQAQTSLKVRTLTGFAAVAGQTATAATAAGQTTTSISVTTTTVNSAVVVAAAYWTATTAMTPNSATIETGEYSASASATGVAGEANALTVTPGTASYGWTNTGLSATVGLAAIELLPAGGAPVNTYRFFAFF